MKSKLIALFAIVAVFGLAIAAYAYTTTTDNKAKASCCAKHDSCPMKSKGHDEKGEHAGMSCPMGNHDNGQAKAEGHSCDCCGDSCPMKKDGAPTSTASSVEGENCCDNCDCCGGKAFGTAA
jgi:hypothetical protein